MVSEGCHMRSGLVYPNPPKSGQGLSTGGRPPKNQPTTVQSLSLHDFFLACSVSYRVSLLFEQEAQFFSW